MNNWPDWLDTQTHTGSQYPYYFDSLDENKKFTFNIKDLIEQRSGKLELNSSSVIEILYKGHIFGDKTLIKGIKRAPWLANINQKENWEFFDIPPHGEIIENEHEIAKNIKSLLYLEIIKNIGYSKKVGILLSGGLDSRIIAGILKEAQLNNDFTGDVVVYNWGVKDSRDVIYSKRIADIYDWNYVHFPLTAELLRDNFYNCSMIGAEISPIHLHAMIKVRDDENSDIVLAGTYGDSLGRGLYSGLHFSNLNNLLDGNINKLSLIKVQTLREYKGSLEEDYFRYKDQLIDKKKSYQLREVEQNVHYLRRLLSTAMSIIAQKKPIYQSFTSPEIVKYVWSLSKDVRNDSIYKIILHGLPRNIGNIPYAKNGKNFMKNEILEEPSDDYLKESHKYSIWLKNDLKSFIDEELDLEVLEDLGIFNMRSIKSIYKFWPKADVNSSKKLDSTISWLTVLSMFVKDNSISCPKIYTDKYYEKLNAMIVVPKIKAYEITRRT